MIKFVHSIFALPFAVLAAFIAAGGFPGFGKIGLVVGCMVLARNVAMTYNRLVDADLDAINPRTANRAIPAGAISRRWAAGFIGINAICFVLITSLFFWRYGNYWPALFSIPVLAYLCIYSHLKRYTWLCHFWLGGAHWIAVLGGFIAIAPERVTLGSLLLALAVGCWTAGFDIIYATLDFDFDRQYAVHSLPAKVGLHGALMISRCLHVLSILGLAIAGYLLGLGMIFVAGVFLAGIILFYEHRLVTQDDLSRVNTAFFTLNGIVSMVLSLMGLLDVLIF